MIVVEEDGIFTAIYEDWQIFGQGKTPEEAFKKLCKSLASYVDYIFEKHPDNWEEKLTNEYF